MKVDRANTAIAIVLGVGTAWAALDLLVFAFGESPRAILGLLLAGTWGSWAGIGQVIFKATPLLFTGVAVDFALRAGLFNIGAEGQVAMSSLAVGVVGASLPPSLPAIVALPMLVAIAFVVGGAWALLPAILRARWNAHEVISTIMMNRIADVVVGFVLGLGFAQAGTTRTRDIVHAARIVPLASIPGLGALRGTAASCAFFVAIVVALLVIASYRKTRLGRELGQIGMNPIACAAEKIPVRRRIGEAMLLSGGLAGLASLGTVLGYKGYFEQGLGAGAGFTGLAVALLGRGNALGLVMAALLFGTLDQGGLAINERVPQEVMSVVQGVVICAVAFADARVRAAAVAGVRSLRKATAKDETEPAS